MSCDIRTKLTEKTGETSRHACASFRDTLLETTRPPPFLVPGNNGEKNLAEKIKGT